MSGSTIERDSNNVHGLVGHDPNVINLGLVDSLSTCEAVCAIHTPTCYSFTWHHPDYPKPEYAGRCYGHTDKFWRPVSQELIDSGRRFDVRVCESDADCSGFNGVCSPAGACACNPGWTGEKCSELKFVPRSARRAFESELWTWGASPIADDSGAVHIFASQITNDCGILHYCSNSRVVHLVATSGDALGPYTMRGVALPPRAPPAWDSGAVHGVSVHALPRGVNASWPRYALYYMGTKNNWGRNGSHPNCTATYDKEEGDRTSRRIGVATSDSLDGPWVRRDAPIFGPGDKAKGEWDYGPPTLPTTSFSTTQPRVTVRIFHPLRRRRVQPDAHHQRRRLDRTAVQGARLGAGRRRGDGARVRRAVGALEARGRGGRRGPVGVDRRPRRLPHAHARRQRREQRGRARVVVGRRGVDGHGRRLHGQRAVAERLSERARAARAAAGARPPSRPVAAPDATAPPCSPPPAQVLLSPPNATGGSRGAPQYLFTSAQDCLPATDGGPGTAGCRSYTMVEQIDLR